MANKKHTKKRIGNAHSTYAIMLIVTSLLLLLSLIGLFGKYGQVFNNFFYGIFGQSIYAICCSMILCGFYLVFDRKITIDKRLLLYLVLLFTTTVIILNCATTAGFIVKGKPGQYLTGVYENGVSTAGGALTAIILCLPMSYVGYAVSMIIFILILAVLSFFVYRSLEKRGTKSKHAVIDREIKPLETSSVDGAAPTANKGAMFIHNKAEESKARAGKGKRFNAKYINEPESEETQELLSESELLRGFEKFDNKDDGEKRTVPAGVYYNSRTPNSIPVVNDFSKDFGASSEPYGYETVNDSSFGEKKNYIDGYDDKQSANKFDVASKSNAEKFGRGNSQTVGYGQSTFPATGNVPKSKITIANNDLFDENAAVAEDKNTFGRLKPETKKDKSNSVFKQNEVAKLEDIYRKQPVKQENVKAGVYSNSKKNFGYNAPPLSLLKQYPVNMEASKSEIEKKRATLERVLINNNYKAKVVGVIEGPTVLRFELRVDDCEDIKRIHSLQARLSYDLANNVNILAPIPNRDLIGIEMANPNKRIIGFREMVESAEFMNSKKLVFALGRSVENKNYYADISEMPHCIVAGTTGSGKSVCLNNLLCSLLYKFSPKELRIILVDPKFVEFNAYYNLPHMLLKEPISQIDKAINALNWAINEMEERYKKFAEIRVRKITEYNEKNPDNFMPYILIMIDEFGDIMMSKKGSVEDLVVRLAQKARAAGIHLIIATQTPKKEIVTGNIKSNCPSRIAFRVTDDVYSRVIIGENGAETLMGNGDMMYKSSRGELERLQAPYISNDEIELITDYIRDNNANYKIDESVENIIYQKDAIIEGFDDISVDNIEFIKKAIEIFLENPQSVSTNVLQRRLGMGHPKASSIIDILEAKGIVSPLENNRRKLLISKEDAESLFNNSNLDA